MKKCSSVVWRFFDRIENEHQRCFAVLCKLCDTQYKFFGNTTNLRSHLLNKHPLQWELSQNGTFDESSFRVEDDESNQSAAGTSPKRRKYNKSYKDKNVRYSVSVDNARNSPGGRIPKIEIQRVDVLENTDVDNVENENEENEATYNLVRQLHDNRGSDEEWLEEDHYGLDTFGHEPKRKRAYRKIKREVQTPPRRTSTYKPASFKSPIVIESNSNKDEYAVFGEYIANKLRKFKAPRTRGNLQQLITTIMWQAEYGLYDNADAVKRLLLYTVTEHEQAHEIQAHIQTEEIIEQNDEPNQSVESESLPTVN